MWRNDDGTIAFRVAAVADVSLAVLRRLPDNRSERRLRQLLSLGRREGDGDQRFAQVGPEERLLIGGDASTVAAWRTARHCGASRAYGAGRRPAPKAGDCARGRRAGCRARHGIERAPGHTQLAQAAALAGEIVHLEHARLDAAGLDENTRSLDLVFVAVEFAQRIERLAQCHILQIDGDGAAHARMHQHGKARPGHERGEHLRGWSVVDGQIEALIDRLTADLRHLHAQRRQRLLERRSRRLAAPIGTGDSVLQRGFDRLRRRWQRARGNHDRGQEEAPFHGAVPFLLGASAAAPAGPHCTLGCILSVCTSSPRLSVTPVSATSTSVAPSIFSPSATVLPSMTASLRVPEMSTLCSRRAACAGAAVPPADSTWGTTLGARVGSARPPWAIAAPAAIAPSRPSAALIRSAMPDPGSACTPRP